MLQVAVIDAGIDMLTFGITTVDKTFRIDCKVNDEEFRGWFDLKGEAVTARRVPGQLIRAKKYVEVKGNVYTLVIRKVQFVDGGNYTCRGDRTEKIFSLFVEFEVIQFPEDQNLFVGRTQTIQCSADGYPKPTFVWFKDFFEINLTNPRFNLLPNGSLLISPVHEKDRGEYVCRITQLGDRQGTSLREQEQEITVTVRGPPRLNVEKSTNQTQQYSFVGSPTPITISCVWWGYPKPKLTIQKDNTDLPSQDVSLKTDDFLSYLTVSVVTVKDDDFGAYTCSASNSFGSASYVVVINKQGPPSVPRDFTLLTSCDHVTVSWEPPVSDGGLPLTRYSVKIYSNHGWNDTILLGVSTTRFTFTSREGVRPRKEYTVTVQAFNELKEGEIAEGSVTSAYCPPRGSFNITNSVTRLNSSSFTLKWTRPSYDGGDPNLKYDIEYSKETTDGKYIHWNTRKNIESQEYNVTGLEGGGNYLFRVFVSNIAARKKEPASKGFSVDSNVSSKGEPCKPENNGEALVYSMSVNCTSFYMQVDFALHSLYLDRETFRFDNKSCGTYAVTSKHVSLRTPLDACGTIRLSKGETIIYSNKVVAETKDKANIHLVEFPFSCTYRAHETIGVPSFQPRKKVIFFEEGFGNFSFNMDLYRSGKYVSPYKVSEYPVAVHPFGQLYCEAKLDTSDSGLILFAEKCVATPSMNPNHAVQYIFIDNGCPVDNGTRYDHTLTQTQRFQLYPFRWIPEHFTLVYLHCKVIVCHKNEKSRCSMGCQAHNRRKRSAGKNEKHRITLGPILLRKTKMSPSDSLNRESFPQSVATHPPGMTSWLIVLSLLAALILLAVVLYGAVRRASFLAASSSNVPIIPARGNPEEMELISSENA